MFSELKNKFKLTINLKTESPLLIKSGNENISPSSLDDNCIKSYKDGKDVVFIPGSTLKGVIRSRCEKIFNSLSENLKCCEITNKKNSCNSLNTKIDAENTYKKICPACKMFGSMRLAGRIKIKDAYPVGRFKIGHRTGVGIDRITGGAHKGALYDFEVVEDGKFNVVITGENYELYQLKVLLWVLHDIKDGFVTFGSSSTRGYGVMDVDFLNLEIRDYRNNINVIKGYFDDDIGKKVDYQKKLYFGSAIFESLEEVEKLLEKVDVESAQRR